MIARGTSQTGTAGRASSATDEPQADASEEGAHPCSNGPMGARMVGPTPEQAQLSPGRRGGRARLGWTQVGTQTPRNVPKQGGAKPRSKAATLCDLWSFGGRASLAALAAGFQDRCLKPLGHPSGIGLELVETVSRSLNIR
jgi:hypothetical protein